MSKQAREAERRLMQRAEAEWAEKDAELQKLRDEVERLQQQVRDLSCSHSIEQAEHEGATTGMDWYKAQVERLTEALESYMLEHASGERARTYSVSADIVCPCGLCKQARAALKPCGRCQGTGTIVELEVVGGRTSQVERDCPICKPSAALEPQEEGRYMLCPNCSNPEGILDDQTCTYCDGDGKVLRED